MILFEKAKNFRNVYMAKSCYWWYHSTSVFCVTRTLIFIKVCQLPFFICTIRYRWTPTYYLSVICNLILRRKNYPRIFNGLYNKRKFWVLATFLWVEDLGFILLSLVIEKISNYFCNIIRYQFQFVLNDSLRTEFLWVQCNIILLEFYR